MAEGQGFLVRHRAIGRVVSRWRIATAVGALILVTSPPQAADAQPLATGISWLSSDDPVAFQHVRDTGAQFLHTHIYWHEIAPSQEPDNWQPTDPQDRHYNWAETDAAVIRATEAGLTPVLLVIGAPSWAQIYQTPPPASSGGQWFPRPEALAAFATAAARRYSGSFLGLPRVKYWQGLSEPNLSLVYNPQFEDGKAVSPTLYRALINAFYSAIKSVNPSNLVIAGGLGPIARPRWTIGPMRFTRELLCMTGRHNPRPTRGNCDGGVHFDIFDMHPYTTGGPMHKGHVDDVQMGDLPKLQELLRAADEAGRIHGKFRHTPLWITEFSWDSKPPDPGGVPMQILKRWTAEALYRAWDAGVSRFFWFSLRDFPPNDLIYGVSVQSGLYFRGTTVAEDRPKPSMYAFRFPFVAYSRNNGFFFWGRTATSTAGRVVIQVREGERWRNASVARADANGIFTGVAQTTYGRNQHGMVRARYRGKTAVPFSLRPVKDFYQPPFGKLVG